VPTPEEREAAILAKRKAIEALHDTYEAEIAKLGQTEKDLLAERLASLRDETIADIPSRFEAKIASLSAEADKLVNQLERYFQKLKNDGAGATEAGLADADRIKARAAERIKTKVQALLDEIDEYGREHWQKEQSAFDRAFEALEALVTKAQVRSLLSLGHHAFALDSDKRTRFQGELGFAWTWLEDVRVVDWTRMCIAFIRVLVLGTAEPMYASQDTTALPIRRTIGATFTHLF
jgi:phage host-nuclease inhibitor protein Gam